MKLLFAILLYAFLPGSAISANNCTASCDQWETESGECLSWSGDGIPDSYGSYCTWYNNPQGKCMGYANAECRHDRLAQPASARVTGRCICKEGHFGRPGEANPKRVWWFYTASLDGARSRLMSPYLSSEAHCREASQEHVDSGFCAAVEVRALGR